MSMLGTIHILQYICFSRALAIDRGCIMKYIETVEASERARWGGKLVAIP